MLASAPVKIRVREQECEAPPFSRKKKQEMKTPDQYMCRPEMSDEIIVATSPNGSQSPMFSAKQAKQMPRAAAPLPAELRPARPPPLSLPFRNETKMKNT